MSKLVCPGCGKKLTEKNFDADYEWYECPKCEGCFMPDEIIVSDKPTAKGKKRHENLDAEEEALKEFEKKQLVPKASTDITVKHRDEIRTKEVVNIMADEIQAIYEEFGSRIDEINAQDKALILWRDAKYYGGGSAREIAVEHALCEAHG